MASCAEPTSPQDYVDETIQCCGCHNTFTWSARAQALHHRKGYQHKPKRCSKCRRSRNNRDNGNKIQRPKYGPIDESRSDRELILELCKSVGELRVYLDKQFKALDQRLDHLENDLFDD